MITTFRVLSRCAFVLVFGFGLPAGVLAQGQGKDPSRDSAAAKEVPLTGEQRKMYIGNYTTELPGGDKVNLRIFDENGALKLHASDAGEPRHLLYQGNNVFLVENTPGFVLTFTLVHNTATTFKVHKPEEGDFIAVRVN
jgi:hypothetical protein